MSQLIALSDGAQLMGLGPAARLMVSDPINRHHTCGSRTGKQQLMHKHMHVDPAASVEWTREEPPELADLRLTESRGSLTATHHSFQACLISTPIDELAGRVDADRCSAAAAWRRWPSCAPSRSRSRAPCS